MPVRLEGGCVVTSLREGAPDVQGSARTWHHFPGATQAISLHVLEFGTGVSEAPVHPGDDELLYAVDGEAIVTLDGRSESVAAHTAFYRRPGASLFVDNRWDQPFLAVGARTPATPNAGTAPPSYGFKIGPPK